MDPALREAVMLCTIHNLLMEGKGNRIKRAEQSGWCWVQFRLCVAICRSNKRTSREDGRHLLSQRSHFKWCVVLYNPWIHTTFSYICLSALIIDLCALMKVTGGKILSSSDSHFRSYIFQRFEPIGNEFQFFNKRMFRYFFVDVSPIVNRHTWGLIELSPTRKLGRRRLLNWFWVWF